ncbi:hypothetical protein CDL12_00260 [Handroanthus impetiginosus]|uniref:Uncharacterized protein n=1 Tax=Handroanthus impetiginosus TaxID=429701 RepID=A0A2G9IB59_9LAMI|nr:hypothetical protein CDL12_00260 [Handroanthus impetiginosus]
MVRGKNINFSARAINSLFNTPSIDTLGELQEFLEDHPSLDTICELICRDDSQWTLSRLNEPIHFSHSKLTFAADNWLRFISAWLLPSSHIFESAMSGLTVDLYHPSLITELCACAGLEEWVDRLTDEVHHLQLQQEQRFAYQQQCNRPCYPPDEPAEPPPADMGDE